MYAVPAVVPQYFRRMGNAFTAMWATKPDGSDDATSDHPAEEQKCTSETVHPR
jgi:hypothetical protein